MFHWPWKVDYSPNLMSPNVRNSSNGISKIKVYFLYVFKVKCLYLNVLLRIISTYLQLSEQEHVIMWSQLFKHKTLSQPRMNMYFSFSYRSWVRPAGSARRRQPPTWSSPQHGPGPNMVQAPTWSRPQHGPGPNMVQTPLQPHGDNAAATNKRRDHDRGAYGFGDKVNKNSGGNKWNRDSFSCWNKDANKNRKISDGNKFSHNPSPKYSHYPVPPYSRFLKSLRSL